MKKVIAFIMAITVALFFAIAFFGEKPNASYAGRDWFQYESDGHVFLRRYDGAGSGWHEQIMHHPDCPCQKKETTK